MKKRAGRREFLTVLDAFALIAFLTDETPAAAEVEAILRSSATQALLSAVNLAETVDQLVRVAGQAERIVVASLHELFSSRRLTVIPADEAVGRAAGLLRARHYRRHGSALSMADCFAMATCLSHSAALATADPALALAARIEGVELLPLPDSTGRRP